jgi:nitrate/TMAO reductase-like tetraheme cytochrome c subunit
VITYKDISEVDKMVCEKSPTHKHNLKDQYTGTLREVAGEVRDTVKYEGTYCIYCWQQFAHHPDTMTDEEVDRLIQRNEYPLDPRD